MQSKFYRHFLHLYSHIIYQNIFSVFALCIKYSFHEKDVCTVQLDLVLPKVKPEMPDFHFFNPGKVISVTYPEVIQTQRNRRPPMAAPDRWDVRSCHKVELHWGDRETESESFFDLCCHSI